MKKPTRKDTRLPLDAIELEKEVIADLDADDTATDAILGGRSSSGGSIKGSIAGSVST